MSVILLLSTTALSLGFFWLIGMETVGYIPAAIATAIVFYGLRSLYRTSPERQNIYAPYLQRQSLILLLATTLARAFHYRITADWGLIRSVIMTIFACLSIGGIISSNSSLHQSGNAGYVSILIIGIITSLINDNLLHRELVTVIVSLHRLMGIGMIMYRRRHHMTKYIDQLSKILTYLGYSSLILICFSWMNFTIASLITSTILGGILISLPQRTLDVTPDVSTTITAQDILEGRKVLDTTPTYDRSPTRQHRRGIQPRHGLLLIRIIIGILAAAIIYQLSTRYTLQGAIDRRNIIGFISLTIISITVCILYYLSHRDDGKMTLWKIATIILTNIATGIAIVHLFYPYTQTIVLASIIRNTCNNIAIRWLYRGPYHDILHAGEYYYRMIANIIITIINSILIMTMLPRGGRQSTTIILLGYRGLQGALLYQIYTHYQSYDLTRDEIQTYLD